MPRKMPAKARAIIEERLEGTIDEYLMAHEEQLSDPAWGNWRESRKQVAALQLIIKNNNIEVGAIDGLWGPQTEFGYDSFLYLTEHGALPPTWRDIEPLDVNPNGWPLDRDEDLEAFYGRPCAIENHRQEVPCPWTLRLSWDLSAKKNSIKVHPKVAESLERVLTNVFNEYGEARIKELGLDLYGGVFNCRRQRGGSRYSTHAYAASIDWDPQHNRLRWNSEQARLAKPEYDAWWQAWEEEGWVSLGRSRNFDWMHVQAAKLAH